MAGLLRDTVFGHMVRALTNKRFFRYEEETRTRLCLEYMQKRGCESNNTIGKGSSGSSEYLEDKDRSGSHTSVDQTQHSTRTGTTTSALDAVEVSGDANLVGWYGPQDEANPINWSTTKKCFVTFQICFLTMAVYTGSSIYAPAIPDIAEIFGVSEVAATLGLPLFVLGYGLGPMLWSPLSDVPCIGRSPIYIGTLAVFIALQGALCTSRSFGALMTLRFLTGCFGSPVLATGGATCADLFVPSKRAYAMSIWGVSAVCGPALGPVIGGYVTEYGQVTGPINAPWEWPMYTLLWLCAGCFISLFFLLPETSSSNILFRRAQRLRKMTGNSHLMSTPEIEASQMQTRDIVRMVLIHPFTLNFTEPMLFFMNLYVALLYGLLYIWFESFPIVFNGIYGFTLGQGGLAFLGILVGVVITIPPFFWWAHRYLEPQFDENGEITPEKRLPTCFVGAFCIPICLFWFGWSARPDVHWIVPIIGTVWFSVGIFLLFIAILNYLPDAYPNHISSVLAGNDLLRSCFGAAFPLFAKAMYTKLGVSWASSTLAFISIAFIPIPFVLYKYGAILRNSYSKIARKDQTIGGG